MGVVRPRYEWLYVYGFVEPASGKTCWLLLPTVSIEAFRLALAEFAQEVGAGPDKQVILLIDQAGWHVSAKVQVPTGLHLLPLPAYSPELQPAEHLWPLTNEPLANRHFATLAELDEVVGQRCVTLGDNPDLVRSHTHFHWWPVARQGNQQ